MNIEQKDIDKFHTMYEQVTETGCWLWNKGTFKDGYGAIWSRKQMQRAHRLSYEIHKGEIPKGLDIMHSCDVRCCVNPVHLSAGTRLDNMRDCANKNRTRQGIKHPRAKLTEEAVLDIRTKRLSNTEFAKLYNVSTRNIRGIQHYKTWKHLI